MRTATLLGLVLTSSLAACSGDHGSGDDEEPVNCALETTADQFVVGLEKTGANGMLDFQLMSATPAPPARGDNEWILQVRSMNNGVVGAPISNATIYVTPFMPKHGHSSPVDAVVTPMPTVGEYKLSPVNLWMPGLWETTIEVDATPSSSADNVVYRFCLPG